MMSIYFDAIAANSWIMACLMVFVYFLDRSEKEPIGFYIRVYSWSIIATLVFGIAVSLLYVSLNISELIASSLMAPVLEEALKLGLFLLLVYRNPNLNEKTDAIIYAMVIGLGFSVTENVQYTVMYSSHGLQLGMQEYLRHFNEILLLRAAPGHLMFGAIGGHFLSRARFGNHPGRWILVAYSVTTLSHICWNSISYFSMLAWVIYALSLFLLAIFLTLRAARSSRFRIAVTNMKGRLYDTAKSLSPSTQQILIRQLRLIGNQLSNLSQVPGDEQNAMLHRIDHALAMATARRNGADMRSDRNLDQILGELKELESRTNWQTLMLLVLALTIVSVFLLTSMQIIETILLSS